MSSLLAKLRFRASDTLRMAARRIAPPGAAAAPAYYNIGADKLPPHAPRALIIYTTYAIRQFLAGTLDSFPGLNKHVIYWESTEMIRLLNEAGYIVDYVDLRHPPAIDWNRYRVVIDERDHLKDAPAVPGQTRIYYSTSNHWFFHNMSELTRTQWFHDRHGIWLPPKRQIAPILSDEYSDIMTYYGTDFQANLYHARPIKHQLDISTVFTPPYHKKNIEQSRKNFLWLSGGGMMFKGADIVMEAFAGVPDAHLYIAGNCQDESRFWDWCKPLFDKHSNMHYLGWVDVMSQKFQDIANNCIGIAYPSSTEGGPSAVAQALHYGLIPLVTRASNVRAEHLGFIVDGKTDKELIADLQRAIREVMALPANELAQRSDAVRNFALTTHTRDTYSKSFQKLIERLAR